MAFPGGAVAGGGRVKMRVRGRAGSLGLIVFLAGQVAQPWDLTQETLLAPKAPVHSRGLFLGRGQKFQVPLC